MIYPQNLQTPKNNDISEPPPQKKIKKNIEIQDFEPPKMVLAYVYIWKYQSTPLPHTRIHFLGASGCEKRTLQK